MLCIVSESFTALVRAPLVVINKSWRKSQNKCYEIWRLWILVLQDIIKSIKKHEHLINFVTSGIRFFFSILKLYFLHFSQGHFIVFFEITGFILFSSFFQTSFTMHKINCTYKKVSMKKHLHWVSIMGPRVII